MQFPGRSYLLIFTFLLGGLRAQYVPEADIIFDFNDHTFNEKHGKSNSKPVGVSLVNDRFGNEKSALYLHGNPYSYLNLGTSSSLKPKKGTLSFWVNLDRKVFAGKGYESNPIISTKNTWACDFYDAYQVFYDFKSKRFMSFSSKDSTGVSQAGVNSIDTVIFNKWYHIAVTWDNEHIGMYINGELQELAKKDFETQYQEGDSVIVGNGASNKNHRWMRGTVDDIMIFYKPLSADEVKGLYSAQDPTVTKRLLYKIGISVGTMGLIVLLIVVGYKRKLRRQKEQYELNNRITELEMQVVKAQMNPHFISNSLAAIQDLILKKELDKAVQYLAKFSFFLRQVLNYSDRTYISLKEELEIITLDVELEQLRFKDNFEFELRIEPALQTDEVKVPSLITQPFIENAIWHGLLSLKDLRKPKLKISIFKKDDNIIIEIEDNGVGRKQTSTSKNSRGTKLVKDKLESINKLTNTNNYRLEVLDLFGENGSASGTRVILQLANYAE